ncbi:MAG: alpha/beta hydrolase [Proteobacteria bacterium]|nr:alpha/beta hydrolase [Pseudomonadota bacterium]
MAYRQFGSEDGRIVVYFHGAPGAISECAVFDQHGKEHHLSFIAFDRFAIDSSLAGETYYQTLAELISGKAGGETVDLVGFSIGAFVALQTCRHLGSRVRSLHLVSAAAPLEAGDFLESMAGSGVFKLAKDAPALFERLSRGQGLLARLFPAALFRMLFASAAGEDRVLRADQAFQAGMKEMLRTCFVENVSGYTRDVEAYVKPWRATLADVMVETHIWHGKQDNWSPVAMAEWLSAAIPGCSHLEIMDGLSHYSCLYRSVERICHRLARP